MARTRTIGAQQAFAIFSRDKFSCLFCGAKPGSENLEVDHLYPVSLGGSDNSDNLATACRKCNRGKAISIAFPPSMIVGPDRDPEWTIHKKWGEWAILFCSDAAVCEYMPYEYWIGFNRVWEMEWFDHIDRKGWDAPHSRDDLAKCLEYARKLVAKPSRT